MHNFVHAVALALANQELQQQLKLIVQAYDRLAATSGIAAESESPWEVMERPASDGGRVFSFGPFRLFPSRRLLVEGNIKVNIGSRAFDILTTLVERAGEVVGKDELIARVWPKVFVDESNLKTQVSALRRTLGESRVGRCYIVTVPGRGYNFVASVSLSERPVIEGTDLREVHGHDPIHVDAERHAAESVPSPPGLTRILEPCR